MEPPDLDDDWEKKQKEDREAERRQIMMFAASIDPVKQGTKYQLLSAFKTWEKIQDSILDQIEGLTP